MLVSHWNPINTVHDRTLPLVSNNVEGVVAVCTSGGEQVVDFLVDDLDELDFDRKGEVRVEVTSSCCVLAVALVLEDVEEVVGQEGHEPGVRLVAFNGVRFARASRTVHENRHIHSFSQGAQVGRKLRSANRLTVESNILAIVCSGVKISLHSNSSFTASSNKKLTPVVWV